MNTCYFPADKFIILIVIFLALFGIFQTTMVPQEKRCEKVDDCVFVRTKCCPGCTGFESVNKMAAQSIEEKMSKICNEECPLVECESETGFAISPVPVCINNLCDSVDELNCQLFCKYFSEEDDQIYMEYLIKTSEKIGKNIEDIAKNCGC